MRSVRTHLIQHKTLQRMNHEKYPAVSSHKTQQSTNNSRPPCQERSVVESTGGKDQIDFTRTDTYPRFMKNYSALIEAQSLKNRSKSKKCDLNKITMINHGWWFIAAVQRLTVRTRSYFS